LIRLLLFIRSLKADGTDGISGCKFVLLWLLE